MQPFILKAAGAGLNMLTKLNPSLAGKKGFELFCYPVRTKLKPRHLDFFDTARRFRFQHRGIDVQCYQWGAGRKTVLLLHGWQSHSFRWKTYVEALVKTGFTVYALDAPGHGLSSGRQLNLLLYSSVLQEFLYRQASIDSIIAHSFGGYAGIYALFCKPELPVKRMVLMGTPGRVTDFIELYNQTLGLNAAAMDAIRNYFTGYTGHAPEYFDAPQLTRNLSKPVLFVHDTEDAEAPYRHAAEMYANWHNAQLLSTSGLGHQLKSPEVMRQVIEFVDESVPVMAPAADNIFAPVH